MFNNNIQWQIKRFERWFPVQLTLWGPKKGKGMLKTVISVYCDISLKPKGLNYSPTHNLCWFYHPHKKIYLLIFLPKGVTSWQDMPTKDGTSLWLKIMSTELAESLHSFEAVNIVITLILKNSYACNHWFFLTKDGTSWQDMLTKIGTSWWLKIMSTKLKACTALRLWTSK